MNCGTIGRLFGCYKCILPLVAVGFFKGEVFGVGVGYSTGGGSCGNVQGCLWAEMFCCRFPRKQRFRFPFLLGFGGSRAVFKKI